MKTLGIHWFRRDLRVSGNNAFIAQMTRHEGRVVGLFTFDRQFLSRPDISHNRFQFFLETLAVLREELRSAGSDLLVLDLQPDAAFKALKNLLPAKLDVTVSWNRDYEPFARRRDEMVTNTLESLGWQATTFRDHLLFEPGEILSKTGTPYKVFTPFSHAWLKELGESGARRLQESKLPANLRPAISWRDVLREKVPTDALNQFIEYNRAKVTIPIPKAGPEAAMEKLKSFAHIVDHYVQDRDILDRDGTSDLSMFLKNGSITITQIINHFGLINTKPTPGKVAFLRQLIWREFYFHILWHWPHGETESFNPKYRDLPWENNQEMFSAWTSGKTGYPVVDAAMRQLAATGRMHNRARMIVASFLTKDLLIDWRWGERWFMNQLLDGDLAANNGGWQWAASTGCDPQPYFRIFNPTRQSERFDPDGDYIRRWVPELRDLAAKEIHWPSDSLRKSTRYPAPIVDHGKQSIKAQMLFKK